jgi:two-component system, LytTR family, sensor kinase
MFSLIKSVFLQKKVMLNLKSLHLDIGVWVCLGLSIVNLLRDYAVEQATMNLAFMVVPFMVVYVSMLAMWIMVFKLLTPKVDKLELYGWSAFISCLVMVMIVMLPFSIIGLYLESKIFGEVEGFSEQHYYILFFIRAIFQFAMVCFFKYAFDVQEQKKYYLEEAHLLREANSKAQFEILKQQINPHFLFNALSTLKSLIRVQDPNAEHFVMNLSDVYRKLLQRREQELIRLSDEMEIVNSYLFMQQLRFENNLTVEIAIPPMMLSLFLPPFALQLLIENTIKHNIISQRKPLRIRIFVNENKYVVVENNIQPKKSNEESTGWGLSSLIERYATFTTKEIDIQETTEVFKVALPLLEEE